MKKQMWVRKLLSATLVLTLIFPMLVACSNNNESKENKERVLRIGIMYGGYDDSYFRQQFTDIYEMTHQNVRIDIVPAIDYSQMQYDNMNSEGAMKEPDRMEAVKKLLTGDNPVDIIVTDTGHFQQLAREGLLMQLDTKMQAEKIDTSDFVPAVFDGLKAMGDNNLYGLTPTFYSSALLYNKKLFQDAGVPFPTDGMSWDDIFTLARNVSKGEGADRKYGFAFERYQGSDLFWSVINNYVKPLNLRMFDDNAEKMTVNTPQWEKVWTTVAKLGTDQIVPTQNNGMMMDMGNKEPGPFDYDMFLSGKVAMVMTDFNYLNNEVYNAMRNASKIKNFTPFEYDVVTVPTHAENPGVSSSVQLNNIFAINNNAPNADDAWDFIKYIHSPEWAKVRSRSSYEMVSRKSYIKPKEGSNYNIQAFYNVKPLTSANLKQDEMMYGNYWQVQDIGRQQFQEVINGTKSVKDALAEWEKQGNEALKQIKANQNGVQDGVYNKPVG
ncbi:ABC transporter substrate-binding protein [Paenibacillus marinisediminis]